MISNITGHLSGALQRIQYCQTALFYKADPDYGTRVATSLGMDIGRVTELEALSDEARVFATNS
ncbi:catalase-related domain-containing protein [Sporomusa sp. KB1]|uniref:catalase-related domain-containing protein n=1 Tax=Sporomusa sp. KB1 TaxID=943346 RepID=UPI0011A7687A